MARTAGARTAARRGGRPRSAGPADGAGSGTDPAAALRHFLRPRLTAIAPTAAEVVREAGGWLFDQAMAGWDVTVITTDHPDPRPLRMLGARDRDIQVLSQVPVAGQCLQAVAVRADLYESDPAVHDLVLAAVAIGGAEIRVWGDRWPAGLGGGPDLVSHHLSIAARAFKAQALAAVAATARPPAAPGQAAPGQAAPGAPGDGASPEVEVFRRADGRPDKPGHDSPACRPGRVAPAGRQ